MRCWQCDVEPDEVHEVVSAESAEPIRRIPGWPAGDHPHAEKPPTGDELLDEALGIRRRSV